MDHVLYSRIISFMDANSKYIKKLWYSKNRNQLIKLFAVVKFYGISTKKIGIFLGLCAKQDKTDFVIMELINKMVKKANSPPDKNRGREEQRGKDVVFLLKSIGRHKPKGMYLDIGSSNGLITKAIGAALGLPKENIYAVDVEQWIGQENKVDEDAKDHINFSFININDEKKSITHYKDGTFKLITILQALHHFENLNQMMKEIQRLSSLGGTIIIREHNTIDKTTQMLTDLEHLIYGILYDGLSIDDFANNYYGAYKSSDEWDAVFEEYGFECVFKTYKTNPTKYYYAVYVNVAIH